MTAPEAVMRYLYAKLTANASLMLLLATPPLGKDFNVYSETVTEEAVEPYVIFELIPGMPHTMINQSVVAMYNFIVQVKGVIATRDNAYAQQMASFINQAIDQASSTAFGGFQINSYRLGEIPTASFDVKDYRQGGARYMIHVRPSL